MSIDKFVVDGQDLKVVEKIHSKIADMLTHSEHINYIALQKKPAVTLLPDSITISNKRIFLCEFTKLGLATNFEIFSWKDIKDIAFKEEIFGSKVTVIPCTGENLSIDYIPKTQARKLYQLIKEALENVNNIEIEDKPQVLEVRTEVKSPTINEVYKQQHVEMRKEPDAVLPASQVEEKPFTYTTPKIQEENPNNRVTQSSYVVQDSKEDIDDELTLKLKRLKSLYDKQLITQAEYENKKLEILSQL